MKKKKVPRRAVGYCFILQTTEGRGDLFYISDINEVHGLIVGTRIDGNREIIILREEFRKVARRPK